MKLAAAWILLTPAAWGHVVSMSSSDLTIDGTRAVLELRMPLYEVAHVEAPERALLEHVAIGGAQLTGSTCESDAARDQYLCRAEYRFAAPPEQVELECTLAAVTVPNHVHLLRAEMGGKRDQAVFDISFTRATLRFRPPTAAEIAITGFGEGAMRALGGAVQVLFLGALALAARSRRELLVLGAAFAAGQLAAVLALPFTALQPGLRFVEAAAALTLVYLAVEILALPQAGGRWVVAAVLGAFHGLFLHLFLQQTGKGAGWVMAGALAAEAAAMALFGLALWKMGRLARGLRPLQVSASALLVFGLAWFVLRLRG